VFGLYYHLYQTQTYPRLILSHSFTSHCCLAYNVTAVCQTVTTSTDIRICFWDFTHRSKCWAIMANKEQ